MRPHKDTPAKKDSALSSETCIEQNKAAHTTDIDFAFFIVARPLWAGIETEPPPALSNHLDMHSPIERMSMPTCEQPWHGMLGYYTTAQKREKFAQGDQVDAENPSLSSSLCVQLSNAEDKMVDETRQACEASESH